MEREIHLGLEISIEFAELSQEDQARVSPCCLCEAEYLPEGEYQEDWYCPWCE